LREIAEEAFSFSGLISFDVPSSVEIIGNRSFGHCTDMRTISFEKSSKLKRIGERAFAGSELNSITIPASVEEIDGSAFVGCSFLVIEVAAGSRNFLVQRGLLTTADGTVIVRYCGSDQEVIVPKAVELLGKSCFESCHYLENVVFENESKLRRIGSSAFSGCEFLISIAIPAPVEIIEECAFKKCDGLQSCLMNEDANLVEIGNEAFADCRSLRSFEVPRRVERMGDNCLSGCCCIHLLKFGSGESLKNIVGDVALDEGLKCFGLGEISSLFRIEIDSIGVDLKFPGWVSAGDDGSTLLLIHENE
jgi:hypothetical protein